MYFTLRHVDESLAHLKFFHPFFGMDFLVGKLGNLPVGKTKTFSYDGKVDEFLRQYYRPDAQSQRFFQPFGPSHRSNRWLSPRYASTSSQATRTKGDLKDAFIHPKDTDKWGWSDGYVDVLGRKLDRDKKGKVPAYWLAVWLFRSKDWPKGTTPRGVLKTFIDGFCLTETERAELFDFSTPGEMPGHVFTDEPYSDKQLLKTIGRPPDAPPEEGGILNFLELAGVGPSRKLSFSPSERLTIVTGDNGLGKTFLLECAWWSLTGQWADRPALPRLDAGRTEPKITFEISGRGSTSRKTTIAFDWASQSWPVPRGRPTIPGIIVYARVDGSFAIWDPARHFRPRGPEGPGAEAGVVFLSRDAVLDGLPRRSEGLLRDWVKWQNSSDRNAFETFSRVLRCLSPPDMDPLKPGNPTRLPGDVREIPTIVHEYGVVPFLHESAGIRRIATIGYLLVWTWNEHNVYSKQARKPPQRNMVVLIDEMEAHLHPKWQRAILPALLDVIGILSRDLRAQVIVSTHSPLVLASVEESFFDETDALFHLEATPHAEPTLKELPFVRYGKVDAWLTSNLFELKQARSQQGELAVERAKRLLEESDARADDVNAATEGLRKTLASDDEFWPRWLFFVERRGLKP